MGLLVGSLTYRVGTTAFPGFSTLGWDAVLGLYYYKQYGTWPRFVVPPSAKTHTDFVVCDA